MGRYRRDSLCINNEMSRKEPQVVKSLEDVAVQQARRALALIGAGIPCRYSHSPPLSISCLKQPLAPALIFCHHIFEDSYVHSSITAVIRIVISKPSEVCGRC